MKDFKTIFLVFLFLSLLGSFAYIIHLENKIDADFKEVKKSYLRKVDSLNLKMDKHQNRILYLEKSSDSINKVIKNYEEDIIDIRNNHNKYKSYSNSRLIEIAKKLIQHGG